MQIFSTSRSGSSCSSSTKENGRCFTPPQYAAGFTLVELLISMAILALMSGVVFANYLKFDSTTVLKGVAYDIASSVREAQVFSLSVRESNASFDVPFGVHFISDSDTFTFFSYHNSSKAVNAPDPTESDFVPLYTKELGKTIQVDELCAEIGGTLTCDIKVLKIAFERPDFDALFYVKKDDDSEPDPATISHAQIKVRSVTGTNVWYAEVGALGNISVKNE